MRCQCSNLCSNPCQCVSCVNAVTPALFIPQTGVCLNKVQVSEVGEELVCTHNSGSLVGEGHVRLSTAMSCLRSLRGCRSDCGARHACACRGGYSRAPVNAWPVSLACLPLVLCQTVARHTGGRAWGIGLSRACTPQTQARIAAFQALTGWRWHNRASRSMAVKHRMAVGMTW